MGRLSVNRYLKNKAMDAIDHALGRPVDPMGETYRNYFAATGYGFQGNPHWVRGKVDGNMAFWHVTKAGRKALANHLRQIGDKHRLYEVTCRLRDNTEPWNVVGTSHGNAKYSSFLDVSDSWPDLTFGEFCRATTCRLAPRENAHV